MKESIIQTSIERYLIRLEKMGKILYIKNNSGAYAVKGRYVRFGKRGSSDFLVFYEDGRTLHLEVKNEKGKQSAFQKAYQESCEKLGHEYVVVRSLEEV